MSEASEYKTDILTWSERQAALLLRVGAGEMVNDQVDWVNVAEEIDGVGRLAELTIEVRALASEQDPR